MSKGKALAPVDAPESDLSILNVPMDELLKTIGANLGTSKIQVGQFDRIPFPTSGGLSWEVPGIMGVEHKTEISGVVVSWENRRVFWKEKYTGIKVQPDCYSPDGQFGIGNPGGECDLCPFAEFGSAAEGTGQACKAIRRVFLVQPEEILPVLISIPPTSIDILSKFFLRLLSRNIPYYGVVVNFALERRNMKSGWVVSAIAPTVTRILTMDERHSIEQYQGAISAAMADVPMTREDYGIPG